MAFSLTSWLLRSLLDDRECQGSSRNNTNASWVADGRWRQFVYARQRICTVLCKLLRKSGSGHKIKTTQKEIWAERSRRAYEITFSKWKLLRWQRCQMQREVALRMYQLHTNCSHVGIEGDCCMTALPEISERFIGKNRRVRSPTEMFTQTIGRHVILTSKQILNFLSICT